MKGAAAGGARAGHPKTNGRLSRALCNTERDSACIDFPDLAEVRGAGERNGASLFLYVKRGVVDNRRLIERDGNDSELHI